jgi:hypothetical protein
MAKNIEDMVQKLEEEFRKYNALNPKDEDESIDKQCKLIEIRTLSENLKKIIEEEQKHESEVENILLYGKASAYSNNCGFHCTAETLFHLPDQTLEAIQHFSEFKRICKIFKELYQIADVVNLEFIKEFNAKITHPYDFQMFWGPVIREAFYGYRLDHYSIEENNQYKSSFRLISNLSGDNSKALPGILYLSEEGEYLIRDSSGTIQTGLLDTDGIDMSHLLTKLTNNDFKVRILNKNTNISTHVSFDINATIAPEDLSLYIAQFGGDLYANLGNNGIFSGSALGQCLPVPLWKFELQLDAESKKDGHYQFKPPASLIQEQTDRNEMLILDPETNNLIPNPKSLKKSRLDDLSNRDFRCNFHQIEKYDAIGLDPRKDILKTFVSQILDPVQTFILAEGETSNSNDESIKVRESNLNPNLNKPAIFAPMIGFFQALLSVIISPFRWFLGLFSVGKIQKDENTNVEPDQEDAHTNPGAESSVEHNEDTEVPQNLLHKSKSSGMLSLHKSEAKSVLNRSSSEGDLKKPKRNQF